MFISNFYKKICKIFHIYFYILYRWFKRYVKGSSPYESASSSFIILLIMMNILFISSNFSKSIEKLIFMLLILLVWYNYYLIRYINKERIEKYKNEYESLNPYLKITFKIIMCLYIIFSLYGLFLVFNP